jgi:hypothetical protein
MSNGNLNQPGPKPYENLDIHDLRCRGNQLLDGTLTSTSIATQRIINVLNPLQVGSPIAWVYDAEYMNASFSSVSNTSSSDWTGLTNINPGNVYTGTANTISDTVTFTTRGMYLVKFIITITEAFTTGQSINFRFVNTVNPTADRMSYSFNGNGVAGEEYTFCSILDGLPNDAYKFSSIVNRGIGP